MITTKPLTGIPAIRNFFRTNETPIYFVSATAFNLLGIDRWVRNFRFVNYYDSFDGMHPNVFVPKEQTPRAFESIEEIVNYLLGHKEVGDLVAANGGSRQGRLPDVRRGDRGARRGARARCRVPDGVAAAPDGLEDRDDAARQRGRRAERAEHDGPRHRLPRRCSQLAARRRARATTSSCRPPTATPGRPRSSSPSEGDWKEHEKKIVGEQIKVMKRIEPRELAIEGVITRHGTLVGPLMAELTGFPELTPYDGGWCGNDVSPELLTEKQRRTARERTIAMGERLRQEGYRGYFELDFLLDADTGEMWLGELNPRVTGASSITNVTAVAYGDMPLFLFHLLEFMDVDFEFDVDELNERWAQAHNLDEWTQFILKQTEDVTELITEAPRSGIWRHAATDRSRSPGATPTGTPSPTRPRRSTCGSPGVGQYRYPGADLGIMVTRGRFMDEEHELLDRAREWITGIKGQFASVPPGAEQPPAVKPEPFGFKML